MKTLREYANAKKGGADVILERKVESKSKKGKYYIVSLHSNGYLDCSCVASQMKAGVCSHKKTFVNWIINQTKPLCQRESI